MTSDTLKKNDLTLFFCDRLVHIQHHTRRHDPWRDFMQIDILGQFIQIDR
jgi:hypothetical protein